MPLYYSVEFPTFQPAMRNILSITQAYPAVFTTTFDGVNPGNHQYLTGLIVRIHIPPYFGMEQINLFTGPITVLSDSTFSMDIDSSNFDAFVVPPSQPGNLQTPAQIVPVGEVTETLTSSTRNVLPYT